MKVEIDGKLVEVEEGGDWIADHQFEGLQEKVKFGGSEAQFDEALLRVAEMMGIHDARTQFPELDHGKRRDKIPA